MSFIFLLTCGGAVAYYQIGELRDLNLKRGEWLQRLSAETSSLRERCAKIEGNIR